MSDTHPIKQHKRSFIKSIRTKFYHSKNDVPRVITKPLPLGKIYVNRSCADSGVAGHAMTNLSFQFFNMTLLAVKCPLVSLCLYPRFIIYFIYLSAFITSLKVLKYLPETQGSYKSLTID